MVFSKPLPWKPDEDRSSYIFVRFIGAASWFSVVLEQKKHSMFTLVYLLTRKWISRILKEQALIETGHAILLKNLLWTDAESYGLDMAHRWNFRSLLTMKTGIISLQIWTSKQKTKFERGILLKLTKREAVNIDKRSMNDIDDKSWRLHVLLVSLHFIFVNCVKWKFRLWTKIPWKLGEGEKDG